MSKRLRDENPTLTVKTCALELRCFRCVCQMCKYDILRVHTQQRFDSGTWEHYKGERCPLSNSSSLTCFPLQVEGLIQNQDCPCMNYATMAFVNAIVMHITLTIQTTACHIACCVTIEQRQNYCIVGGPAEPTHRQFMPRWLD